MHTSEPEPYSPPSGGEGLQGSHHGVISVSPLLRGGPQSTGWVTATFESFSEILNLHNNFPNPGKPPRNVMGEDTSLDDC